MRVQLLVPVSVLSQYGFPWFARQNQTEIQNHTETQNDAETHNLAPALSSGVTVRGRPPDCLDEGGPHRVRIHTLDPAVVVRCGGRAAIRKHGMAVLLPWIGNTNLEILADHRHQVGHCQLRVVKNPSLL